MDMKFKTTKEYKKLKRDFIKNIFWLNLICFFGHIINLFILSFFIYISILSYDKDFPHFVLAIIMSVFAFIIFIFIIIYYIKIILECKVDFDVEKEKWNN
ncbi:Spiroplasmavirus-related protein [Spiroplasma kunkelii CR2-3x]|uniref:Transmembrane protein n=2 Tax=root TaxID=1 RepID=A8RHI5_9VIRU|nr:hypothetical protein [Spiroplasma kunkelii]YP_001552216.1 hypothetical protein SkV1VCR23x_ORF6 [Vespertiliovirus SkV1CR23x]ABU40630.1 unknown [Spiroplasma phage SkV1CR23x]ALA98234.1 Spiroplasmavirus-related protein [Spiroplasma kunkelii CR2-3x]